MQSSLVQVPCKSGSPQGVLGAVQLLAAGADLAACASAGSAVSAKMAAAATNAAAGTRNGCLIRLSSPTIISELLLFLQISVNQFFGKLNTFEFVELRVLFLAPVEDRADLPGPRIYRVVVDHRFVIDMVRVGQ